jgi:hypothetical protein
MSQYIPGLVDYIPAIQPFKPDFNFYQQVLQLKNAEYEEGYNKLSSVYGTLLESPLLRQSNIETRNKFFKDISSQITKISSMDLSRSENVEAAYKVFQPLINDKYLAKDMVFTKDSQSELQKADNFRNCIDEKKCGGKYWEGGVRSIYYKMDDFAKSSNDESLRFSSPKYVPAVNVVEKAIKFAKENGFSQENLTYSPDGRFRIITANGEVAVPYLTDLFNTMFVNDQATVDYYNELGFLKRKDYVEQTKDQFASPEEAELNYLNTISSELINTVDRKNKIAEKTVDNVNTQIGTIKTLEKTRQLNEKDPYDQKTILQKQQLEIDKMVAEMNADIQRVNKETLNPEVLNSNDLFSKRARVDSVVASALLQEDLARAAYDYSMLTQKIVKDQADPYRLADYQQALELEKEKVLQKNRIELATYKESIKKGKKSKEEEEEDGIFSKILKAVGDQYTSLPTGPGNTAKIDVYKEEFIKQNTTSKAAADAVKDVVDKTIIGYKTIIDAPIGTTQLINDQRVFINEDLKQQAKNVLEKLFTQNIAETKQTTVSQELSFSDKALAVVLGVGLSPSTVAEIIVGDRKQDAPITVNKKGLYTDTYNPAVANNEDFYTNPNSDIYYEKVYDNLKTILGTTAKGFNDPLANVILAKSEMAGLMKRADDTVATHKLTQKALMDKEKSINEVVAGNFPTYNLIDSEYAFKSIKNYIKPNGGQKSKEEFVNDYINNLPENTLRKATVNAMGVAVPYSLNPEQMRSDAEELYDEYTKLYKNSWNQEPTIYSDILNSYAVQNSILGGFNAQKGSGAEMQPYTSQGYSNVPTNTSLDFILTHADIQKAIADPELKDQVKIFPNISGDGITADTYKDGQFLTDTSDQMRIMNAIKDSVLQKKKGEKTVGWQQSVHPIIANNYDLVGFEVTLGEDFISKNRKESKGEETPKGLAATTDKFVVVFPKTALSPDNQIITRLDRGPYTNAMILSPTKSVVIDQYSQYGGTFKMEAMDLDPSGLVTKASYTLTLKTIDPETGELIDNVRPGITTDPDKAGFDAESLIGEAFTQNYYKLRTQNN